MPQTAVALPIGRSTCASADAATVSEPCRAAIAVQSFGGGGGGGADSPGAASIQRSFPGPRSFAAASASSSDVCPPSDFAVVSLCGGGRGADSFGLPGSWSLPTVWTDALHVREGRLALSGGGGASLLPDAWDSAVAAAVVAAAAGHQGGGSSSGGYDGGGGGGGSRGDSQRLPRPAPSIFQAAAAASSASCNHIPDTLGLLPPPYAAAGLPFRGGGHHRRRHRRRRSRRRQQQQQRARHRLQTTSAAPVGGRWRRQSSSSLPASGDEPVYSRCFSHQCCRTHLAACLQFRRVLILLASFGVACIVSGVALGALHSPSNSFLTLSLMFVGLGLMLIIVVVIGWRCTPPEHEPCHILFGLGAYCTMTRSRIDRRRRERHYWIGGLLYPEFRFRRPPPSYASAMLDSAAFARRSYPASSEGGVLNRTALLWDLPNAPPPQYKIDVGLHDPASGSEAMASANQATARPASASGAAAASVAAAVGSLPPTYRSSCSGPRLALDEVWLEAAALWAAAAASRAESLSSSSSSSSDGTPPPLRSSSGGLFFVSDAESSAPSRLDTTPETSSSQNSPNYRSTCHVIVDIENAPSSMPADVGERAEVESVITAAAATDLNCEVHAAPPATPPPADDGRVLAIDVQQNATLEITPM